MLQFQTGEGVETDATVVAVTSEEVGEVEHVVQFASHVTQEGLLIGPFGHTLETATLGAATVHAEAQTVVAVEPFTHTEVAEHAAVVLPAAGQGVHHKRGACGRGEEPVFKELLREGLVKRAFLLLHTAEAQTCHDFGIGAHLVPGGQLRNAVRQYADTGLYVQIIITHQLDLAAKAHVHTEAKVSVSMTVGDGHIGTEDTVHLEAARLHVVGTCHRVQVERIVQADAYEAGALFGHTVTTALDGEASTVFRREPFTKGCLALRTELVYHAGGHKVDTKAAFKVEMLCPAFVGKMLCDVGVAHHVVDSTEGVLGGNGVEVDGNDGARTPLICFHILIFLDATLQFPIILNCLEVEAEGGLFLFGFRFLLLALLLVALSAVGGDAAAFHALSDHSRVGLHGLVISFAAFALRCFGLLAGNGFRGGVGGLSLRYHSLRHHSRILPQAIGHLLRYGLEGESTGQGTNSQHSV